jgi:hypothetical protein
MPLYASFNPAAASPQPVLGWYDTDAFSYPNLPAAADLVIATQAQWDAQAEGNWFVNGGVLAQIAPAAPAPTVAQAAQAQFASLIAGGLTITSTATPAINGTYAVDAAAQDNFSATETYVLANGAFPLGATQPWPLLNGALVMIPSIAVFKEVASAAAQFVAAADIALGTAEAGGTPSWPSASATIA